MLASARQSTNESLRLITTWETCVQSTSYLRLLCWMKNGYTAMPTWDLVLHGKWVSSSAHYETTKHSLLRHCTLHAESRYNDFDSDPRDRQSASGDGPASADASAMSRSFKNIYDEYVFRISWVFTIDLAQDAQPCMRHSQSSDTKVTTSWRPVKMRICLNGLMEWKRKFTEQGSHMGVSSLTRSWKTTAFVSSITFIS